MPTTRFTALALCAVISAPAIALAQGQPLVDAAPQTSLAQAIEAAEAAVSDGVAMEAEFEREDGRTTYEIELVQQTGVTRVIIDAATGEILSREGPNIAERAAAVAGRAASYVESFITGDQQVTRGALARAVQQAETSTGARAVEAELEDDGPVFEIELINPERGRIEVTVNAEGNVLPDD